jgi:hypothetical protein
MRALLCLAAAAAASPAFAQAPDKSGYSLANRTPLEALRELSTDLGITKPADDLQLFVGVSLRF